MTARALASLFRAVFGKTARSGTDRSADSTLFVSEREVDRYIRNAIGVARPETAIFIKQYGEVRTGTNAVRALIRANLRDVVVLMHVLGDKHSPPVDLKTLQQWTLADPDPWRIILAATQERPARTTQEGAYLQLHFLKALHEHLILAIRERRLFYVLSAKHPYRWASSLLRYRGWPAELTPGTWDHERASEFLRSACARFNERYRAWWKLHEDSASNSILVHCERLEKDWSGILMECERIMGAKRRHETLVPLRGPVRPAEWDYCESEPYDEKLHKKWPAPVRVTAELLKVVRESVEWDLMAKIGYVP